MSTKSFTDLHLSVLKVIFGFCIPTSTYIQCNCSTLPVLKTRFEPTTLGLGCSRTNQYPITAALIESFVHSSTLYLQLFFLNIWFYSQYFFFLSTKFSLYSFPFPSVQAWNIFSTKQIQHLGKNYHITECKKSFPFDLSELARAMFCVSLKLTNWNISPSRRKRKNLHFKQNGRKRDFVRRIFLHKLQ